MSDKQLSKKELAQDIGYTTAKAFLASIPGIGGAFAEYFNLLIMPPTEKRREQILQDFANALARLEAKVGALNMQNLFSDDQFLSAFLQAFRLALINHNQENLKALRNALLNSALPDAPDEIRQKMFIEWAGEMTAWHIRILRLFGDESLQIPDVELNSFGWQRSSRRVGLMADIIETRYPETKGNLHLYLQILNDLYAKGLLTHTLPSRNKTARVTTRPVLSEIAEEFLAFITSPLDNEDQSAKED